MTHVSLTDTYERFSKGYTETNPSEEKFIKDGTVNHLKSSITDFLNNFASYAGIYLMVCKVYKETSPLLETEPKEKLYDFFIDHIRKTSDNLISNKKLSSTLIDKYTMECLRKELRQYEADTLIKTVLPVRLSFLTTGKFAKRYKEALHSIEEKNPNQEVKDITDILQELEEDTESCLYSLEHSFDLLNENERELAETDIQITLNDDNQTDYFLYDRVLRTFLLIETYRRVCGEDDIKNSTYFYILREILSLNVC